MYIWAPLFSNKPSRILMLKSVLNYEQDYGSIILYFAAVNTPSLEVAMFQTISWNEEWHYYNCLKETRHGNSRKHASIACGQLLRKLWTFLDEQYIFGNLTHKCPQNCVIVHIYPFLLDTISSFGKDCNLWHFYML